MEDPRLHETAEMWKSEQKGINVAAALMALVLAVPGSILLYYGLSEGFIALTLFGGLMVAVGGLIVAAAVYTNFDKKDHWLLSLPYNPALYDALVIGIERELAEAGIYFGEVPYSRFAVRGKAYTVRTATSYDVDVKFALIKVKQKHGYSYSFPLEIRNVRMENLEEARNIQNHVMGALVKIDFLSYRQELY